MVFGMFKGGAKEAINKFSGSKDFLEALCAACAMVGAADGSFDDAEYDATLLAIRSNSDIATAFGASEIEAVLGKMQPKVGNRSGRAQLKTEIRQAIDRDKTGGMAQAIMLAALDVADQGGSIDDKEMAVLKDLSTLCGTNLDKLLAG